MFDSAKVFAAFETLIGWREYYDSNIIPNWTGNLGTSDSGQYYNILHPSLKLQYIKAAAIDKGDTVEDYLTRIKPDIINQMINDVITHKQLNQYNKQLLKADVIYKGEGRQTDKIINEGRFVGFRVKVANHIGIKTALKRIGLQASQTQTGLDIYIFHSSQKQPVATVSFSGNGTDSFKWQDTSQVLYYHNGDITGGVFYIGYYQDDLQGQAIRYPNLTWSNGFCKSCDGGKNARNYQKVSKFVSMCPMYVPMGDYVKGEMFDPNSIIAVDDTNFGLNIGFQSECDLTNFWIDNKLEFVPLLGHYMAFQVLQDIVYTDRINPLEEEIKAKLYLELKGDLKNYQKGIEQRRAELLEALSVNEGSLNSVCLPQVPTRKTYQTNIQ